MSIIENRRNQIKIIITMGALSQLSSSSATSSILSVFNFNEVSMDVRFVKMSYQYDIIPADLMDNQLSGTICSWADLIYFL